MGGCYKVGTTGQCGVCYEIASVQTFFGLEYLEYAIRKVEESTKELELNGTHRLLACAHVTLFHLNTNIIKRTQKFCQMLVRDLTWNQT